MMMQLIKPYDAEISYLGSSGTQRIAFGEGFNTSTDSLEVEFYIPSQNTSKGVVGYRDAAASNNVSIIFASSGNIVVDFNNSEYAPYRLNVAYDTTSLFKCVLSRTLRQIYKNGVLQASGTNTSDIFTTSNFYIFYVDSNFANSSYHIVSFLWKRNGVAYHDFIPVRIGTTGYMYDKVTKQLFGNQGTGDFILGPDI